jgi:hypothetical protein
MTTSSDQTNISPEQDRAPVTRNQVSMRYGGRVWEAIDRRNELDQRWHSARAEAAIKARGEWDPAKFGPGGTLPLTTAEQLERIALDEYISRFYQPHYELDEALKAGATLLEVAHALGCHEDEARDRIRSWAEGQHRLWTGPDVLGNPPHQFGLSDDDYAAVLARTADPETYPGGIGDPANIGIRADRQAPAGGDPEQREAGQ